MGTALHHTPVKLITGLIFRDTSRSETAKRLLEREFGPVENETPLWPFTSTDYYTEEFGDDLKRRFLAFGPLASLKNNHLIKERTNKIERRLSAKGRRTVNIDPGYVTLENLVLFTTKRRSHRIYLDAGIYAERELVFTNGSFRPLEWTYPDYRSKEYIDFFNGVRNAYHEEIKERGLLCV